jgi:hypothetical protein
VVQVSCKLVYSTCHVYKDIVFFLKARAFELAPTWFKADVGDRPRSAITAGAVIVCHILAAVATSDQKFESTLLSIPHTQRNNGPCVAVWIAAGVWLGMSNSCTWCATQVTAQ